MIERLNTCFETPNISSETVFITLDEISSYLLFSEKKTFFSSSLKSCFLSSTGPSYLKDYLKCVFNTGIFAASFGPIFTKND